MNKENPKSSIVENEKLVFEKMCKKYLVIIIRNKISFSAFVNKMTIPELIFKKVQNTFNYCVKSKKIDYSIKQINQDEIIIDSIINN